MLIYCDGIYREIEEKEFPRFEKCGYKKVEIAPKKEEKPKKATKK